MFNKKYILLAVFLAFSSSIFAWFFFYSDYSHPLPIRAKQVFNLSNEYSIACLNSIK